MNEGKVVQTYEGVEIRLTGGLSFLAEIDGDELVDNTAEGLRARIDARLKLRRKMKPLALLAVNGEGKTGTITGIHMGRSTVLTSPSRLDDGEHLYARMPWVETLIARKLALEEILAAVERELGRVKIEEYFGYGRIESDTRLAKVMRQLQESYSKAVMQKEPGNMDKLLGKGN